MRIKKSLSSVYVVFLGISACIFFFYLIFVNFSTDTIILFISQKIYLGRWLARGIVPLYNPLLFAGIPFLFDPGMGHLHPFNLLYLLPYPWSFSLWISLTVFIYLAGFYRFFASFTKTSIFAVILTLILFFSGSGFWRTNNPAILLVIAHYGLFFYSIKSMKTKQISWQFLIIGFLMTVSGHIQFVFYGYMMGFIVAWLFYRIPMKKIFINFLLLGLVTSWFYVLCLPIVLSSTRLTTHKDYVAMGPLHPFQIIQFVMPFFFGYVQNGSKWNVGPTFVILISLLFIPGMIFLAINKKIHKLILAVLIVYVAATLGVINFPFFRGAAQSIIVIHIVGLLLFAQNEKLLISSLGKINKKYIYTGIVLAIITYAFFMLPVFSKAFFLLYGIVKKTPSLFYDAATVKTIGNIVALNFILLISVLLFLWIIQKRKKFTYPLLLVFVVFEGIFINFFHNYFIPQSVLVRNHKLPARINLASYRIQTSSDVVPYFGFHTYMSEVLFRPPFSKEPTSFTEREQRTFARLNHIFSYHPSTWSMIKGFSTIQGYNTFVPKRIAKYFSEPSIDYRSEYDYIIQRNSLFGQSEIGLAINGIETSKITLYDPRWQELGVRYFISDRPLKKYLLIAQDDGRYFYENKNAVSIYQLIDTKNRKVNLDPIYTDPNKRVFDIRAQDIGKKLVINVNPDGFVAEQDRKKLAVEKKGFTMTIPLLSSGQVSVYYSPVFHLQEIIEKGI